MLRTIHMTHYYFSCRATLVCNTLSYVEHYRPLFFQMENVKGMLHFRLNGRQMGARIVGGIEMGMMKFIYRALIALGYVSF
jgi:DNA (cytosine-5)-methyltransferase 1